MIKVFASGNIGKDAETRQVGENSVISWSIASTKKYKDKEQTTWLNCQKWNAGRLSEYLKKGTKVIVSGELEIREHEGKYYTTLNVFDLEFGSKLDTGNQEHRMEKPGGREPDDLSMDIPQKELPDDNTDLPF